MKKLSFLFLFMAMLSCSNKKEHKEFYENGNLKLRIDVGSDGIPNGNYEEYYDSGEIKERGKYKDGEIVDTVYVYHKNGSVKMKGTLLEGIDNGWWYFYDEKGNLIKKNEYVTIEGEGYENQTIKYKSNGGIDYSNSSFYEIQIPDTIKQGKNLGKLKSYYSDFKVDISFIWVVIENKYPDGLVKKDTFSDGTMTPLFGIVGYKRGLQTIKGTIIEEFIPMDTTALGIVKHKKYFEREVWVE